MCLLNFSTANSIFGSCLTYDDSSLNIYNQNRILQRPFKISLFPYNRSVIIHKPNTQKIVNIEFGMYNYGPDIVHFKIDDLYNTLYLLFTDGTTSIKIQDIIDGNKYAVKKDSKWLTITNNKIEGLENYNEGHM